ncbi:MAG: DUF3168 domain-containing protein [Rhizomicrobium sp.]|nr:DUF3168 domain-containing protein [Rhizomicrobium sp.]
MSAAWALQQAVFAALANTAAVQSQVAGRLFDAVPETAALPYIVLGEAAEHDNATASEAGSSHTLLVHIWSRSGGSRESKQIAAAVRSCLDHAGLSLNGHALIDLRFVSADYARQSDGKTFRAVLRFTASTEPI